MPYSGWSIGSACRSERPDDVFAGQPGGEELRARMQAGERVGEEVQLVPMAREHAFAATRLG